MNKAILTRRIIMDLKNVDWKDWRLYASAAVIGGIFAFAAYDGLQAEKACEPVYEKFNAIAAIEGVNTILKQSGAEANKIHLILGKSEGITCSKTLYLKP
jgi:hypothetical protein